MTNAAVTVPATPQILRANLLCFVAMVTWSVGFPAGEVLLQSWGAFALVVLRLALASAALVLVWWWAEGIPQLRLMQVWRGLVIGGAGFGLGSLLLLLGQAMSDAVTPAIAVAMMPIAGAVIEVLFDGRRLSIRLVAGIACALAGGFLAAGVELSGGNIGVGAILCLIAVVLFAWATRATTQDLPGMSPIGQTALTLVGALAFATISYVCLLFTDAPGLHTGKVDGTHIALIIVFALLSAAFAQALWIRGSASLGIMLASFHMNAVPFYVMVCVVILLGGEWNWWQAGGAALVGVGVLIAQSASSKKCQESYPATPVAKT